MSSDNSQQNTNTVTNVNELHQIMKEIETKTENKVLEGYQTGKITLKQSQTQKADLAMKDTLISIMQQGADEFKEKTGRNMTYSEMRQMYG